MLLLFLLFQPSTFDPCVCESIEIKPELQAARGKYVAFPKRYYPQEASYSIMFSILLWYQLRLVKNESKNRNDLLFSNLSTGKSDRRKKDAWKQLEVSSVHLSFKFRFASQHVSDMLRLMIFFLLNQCFFCHIWSDWREGSKKQFFIQSSNKIVYP